MRQDLDKAPAADADGPSVAQILHPQAHFRHPDEVLAAPDLSTEAKRIILAAWASDRFAVDSEPALRHYPGTPEAVTYSDVLRALKALDGNDDPAAVPPIASLRGTFATWSRHVVRRLNRRPGRRTAQGFSAMKARMTSAT
jgi:hypothetical protein